MIIKIEIKIKSKLNIICYIINMSIEELLKEIYFLKEENEKIKSELQETKEHLKIMLTK